MVLEVPYQGGRDMPEVSQSSRHPQGAPWLAVKRDIAPQQPKRNSTEALGLDPGSCQQMMQPLWASYTNCFRTYTKYVYVSTYTK